MGVRWDDDWERRYVKPYNAWSNRPRRNGIGWLPADPAHRVIVLTALAIIVAANLMALGVLH